MTAGALRTGAERELEGRRGLLGWSLVVLLVAGALAIYLLGAQGIASRGTWFVVGEVLGLTAAVLLCCAAILAVRLRPLEWLFGDMTKVYVAHGVVGLTMFGLITLHPLLYVFGTLPHTRTAAGLIVPFALVVLDWITWILIALAMLPTLFVRLRFDLWRWTHLLLGAAVVTNAISLIITSRTFDTVKVPALRAYLGTLFLLAIAAVVYVAFVRRVAEPKHEYRVAGAEHHPEAGAIELRLTPVGRPLRFQPGQFAYVDLVDDRVQVKRDYEAHPFSIASAPGHDELRVIVQAQGAHTERIQGIAAADDAHALLHGAYGTLGETTAVRQLWIGGGIGVTPFLSLAEALAEQARDAIPDVVFVVAVQTAAHAFYLERLRACEARCPSLRVIVWPAQERGNPTIAELVREVPDLADRTALLSGPEVMVGELTHQLHAAGVSRAHVRSELAIGPPRRWRYASPALRVMRAVVATELAVFVLAAIGSTVGRALT